MDKLTRKILHIDMDAFYASVEQRDHPELKGRPIAVGGGEGRGVTTTASYEARAFGVKSAMPGFMAKQLCPQIIFVKPRFEVYKEVSLQVRNIFEEYTDLIEPLSLDEAFLDVTINKQNIKYGMEVAKEIMTRVKNEIDLSCSAGVSYCKFLAKVASGFKKPNGLTIIRPAQAKVFLENLQVKDFFGVGKVTARKMERMNIKTGADLKKYTRIELAQYFGKSGSFYYDIVRGVDDRQVNASRVRKSLGVERTFENNLSLYEEIESVFQNIIDLFYNRLLKADNFGRTISLKIKTAEFKTLTRSLTFDHHIKTKTEITRAALKLLEDNWKDFNEIRLIGLTASNLEKEELEKLNAQLSFNFKRENRKEY